MTTPPLTAVYSAWRYCRCGFAGYTPVGASVFGVIWETWTCDGCGHTYAMHDRGTERNLAADIREMSKNLIRLADRLGAEPNTDDTDYQHLEMECDYLAHALRGFARDLEAEHG